MRRTDGWVAAVVAALLVVSTVSAGDAARADSSLPGPPAPAVLTPVDLAAGAAPTSAGIRAAVGPLSGAGLRNGALIVLDPGTGAVLLDERGARPLIPASTLKLATSTAALTVLGPHMRIPTVAYRNGSTVYLVGGGDPTLVKSGGGDPLAGGSPSMSDLATQAVSGFKASTKVRLVYDDSAFTGPTLGPGWSRTYPTAGIAAPVTALVVDGGRSRPGGPSRVADPSRQAAEAFAGLLRSAGLRVTSITRGNVDASASEIGRVQSPPISDIVDRMLTESENNFAEALAHLTGGTLLDQPSFAGGAAAVKKQLTTLGFDTTGFSVVDGSGLSGRDRAPVRLLAEVLRRVAVGTDPALSAIASGMAVAGLTGTLAERFQTPATRPGRGYVHAKTGTLSTVVGLAGTVLDKSGRVLIFAMIANRVPSLARARDTMDRIASRLASCGCS